jgi:hypothetical protein
MPSVSFQAVLFSSLFYGFDVAEVTDGNAGYFKLHGFLTPALDPTPSPS